MNRAHMISCLAVWLVSAAPTFAAEKQPTAVFTFEDSSCGTWVASAKDPSTRELYLFWFQGFVSGYNFGAEHSHIPLEAMPNQETLALFIDKYCHENPLLPFTSSSFALVKQLRVRTPL